MSQSDQILQVLKSRHGAAQAISAPAICRKLRWSLGRERLVRRIIEKDANGVWPGSLCAIPGMGYFFPETIEEIARYREHLMALKKAAKEKLDRFDASIKREGYSLKGDT